MGLHMGERNFGRAIQGSASVVIHNVSHRPWRVDLNPVSVASVQHPSVVAHEVGHNLSLIHSPGCLVGGDPWEDPNWPEGIAYWGDAPGPVRHWWRVGEWTERSGEFTTPRTSGADSGSDTGVDVMGRCPGNRAISDWYYHRATLFRMAAEGRLDFPADEAAAIHVGGAQSAAPAAQPAVTESPLAATGPSVVVTGSVDADGIWPAAYVDHSERSPTQGAGSYRLAAFGADGTLVGEVRFDPAPVSHSDVLVWSVRVGYDGETPVRLTVSGPDGGMVLDWTEAALWDGRRLIRSANRYIRP